jgi:hypothetical protein
LWEVYGLCGAVGDLCVVYGGVGACSTYPDGLCGVVVDIKVV